MASILIKCLVTLIFAVFYFIFIKKSVKPETIVNPDLDLGNENEGSKEQNTVKANIKRAHANITEIEMCLNMILQREDPIAVKNWCTEELSMQHDYLKLSEAKQMEPPPPVVPFHKSRYNVCKYN